MLQRNRKFLAATVLALGLSAASSAHAADRVELGPIFVDRTEVTIGQFREFVVARGGSQTRAERDGGGFEYTGGWTRRPGWTWKTPYGKPSTDKEPAVHVSWAEARDYCTFVNGRLPTLAEWRLTAYSELRALPTDGFATGRTYAFPVGDTPDGMNTSRRSHVEAGTTKRGVNGLYDMGANVWEWLADRRGDDALTAGGSWWYGPEQARAEGVQWKPADFYAVYVGFRCVYDQRK